MLIGGPTEIAPRFEEVLSASVRDKLAGRFEIEVTYADLDVVRQAAAPCFEEHERRHERQVLDRLAEGLGRGERAVAGFADVLAMLTQARVEILLFDDRVEPPDPAVLEKAIEDAVAQSAEVLVLATTPTSSRRTGTSPSCCASEPAGAAAPRRPAGVFAAGGRRERWRASTSTERKHPMRKFLVGAASTGALLLSIATPAVAAPNKRACANGHGTQHAHATVPHATRGNQQAHRSIPHFCE